MSRKKKPRMEYRYYEAPEKCPVLALLGEKWVQNYGYQIDYLHFHNMMEIGVCYYGEGTIVLEDKEIPYDGGAFTVVPKNFPHTTNSRKTVCAPGHGCLLMWKALSQNCIRIIRVWHRS